jgi:hypothetical protein
MAQKTTEESTMASVVMVSAHSPSSPTNVRVMAEKMARPFPEKRQAAKVIRAMMTIGVNPVEPGIETVQGLQPAT